MQVGLVAFTVPAEMTRDQTYQLTATLDPKRGAQIAAAVMKDVRDTMRIGLTRSLFSSRMTAIITGQGFEIASITGASHPTAVSLSAPTTWQWQVTPRQSGDLTLALTLAPLLLTEVGVAERPQTVMFQKLHVRVSFVGRVKDLLSWLVANWVLLAALSAGLAYSWRWLAKRNKPPVGFGRPPA